MLWKYFQKKIRKKWKISFCFSLWLFTISVTLKVPSQCRSEITWPTVDNSVAWLPRFANFCCITDAVCLMIEIFCQDNKCFHLKSTSSFFTSPCPETFIQNFITICMEVKTNEMTTIQIHLINLMATIYFTNHQKRQPVDFLKQYPYIIYVKNCLEREFQKFALE